MQEIYGKYLKSGNWVLTSADENTVVYISAPRAIPFSAGIDIKRQNLRFWYLKSIFTLKKIKKL